MAFAAMYNQPAGGGVPTQQQYTQPQPPPYSGVGELTSDADTIETDHTTAAGSAGKDGEGAEAEHAPNAVGALSPSKTEKAHKGSLLSRPTLYANPETSVTHPAATAVGALSPSKTEKEHKGSLLSRVTRKLLVMTGQIVNDSAELSTPPSGLDKDPQPPLSPAPPPTAAPDRRRSCMKTALAYEGIGLWSGGDNLALKGTGVVVGGDNLAATTPSSNTSTSKGPKLDTNIGTSLGVTRSCMPACDATLAPPSSTPSHTPFLSTHILSYLLVTATGSNASTSTATLHQYCTVLGVTPPCMPATCATLTLAPPLNTPSHMYILSYLQVTAPSSNPSTSKGHAGHSTLAIVTCSLQQQHPSTSKGPKLDTNIGNSISVTRSCMPARGATLAPPLNTPSHMYILSYLQVTAPSSNPSTSKGPKLDTNIGNSIGVTRSCMSARGATLAPPSNTPSRPASYLTR
eukprot:gene18031-24444_t